MPEYLEQTVNEFTNFLNQQKKIIGKQEYSNHILSYRLPKTKGQIRIHIANLINEFPRVFYFEKPIEQFSLTGVATALDLFENGLGRFSNISKTVRELNNKFISNYNFESINFPLICGAMKFTAEHSEDEWQNFYDSNWFIPEMMILRRNETEEIFYNFKNHHTSTKKILDRFTSLIESLTKPSSTTESKSPRILSTKGISPKDKKKWKSLVTEALDKLMDSEISKIVLSRRIDMVVSEAPNWDKLLNYFMANYPDCSNFIFHNNNSTFFGSSPERLAKFLNGKITIDILAGSASRGANAEDDFRIEKEMLNDSKLINEHELVVKQVKKAVENYVEEIQMNKLPSKKLLNIQHLHTILEADFSNNNYMFDIIESIFPTAAVCGEPKDKALNQIKKIEDYKRGLYSGLIGFFNLKNEGEFIVGIRSALLNENKLYAYAGCGLVEGSNPDDEFEETEMKLKAILSFFNEQNKNK